MDGKLLVLCGERPTINESGTLIDEKGNMLRNQDGKYIDINGNEVEVDTHKKVISGINLLNPIITESTESDILFVDWESIVPSDIEPLQEMVEYAQTTEPIPPQMILDSGKNQSLMKSVHMNRLSQIDENNERPSIDYRFQAMNDFMELFLRTLENNGIVSILPTFPNKEDKAVNKARTKVMQSWRDRNERESQYGKYRRIDVLEPMQYDDFGEIYIRAQDEMLKIISMPDWYEKNEKDEEELGGRQ